MRKLATAAISFSLAVFAANYILPAKWLVTAAVFAAVIGALLGLLRAKWLHPTIIALSFFALGLLSYYTAYNETVVRAEAVSAETTELEVRILSYPVEYDDYCRVEAKIIGGELPRLKAVVYDNSKSLRDAVPGQTARLTAELTPANTYYGESDDRYYAKGIFLKAKTDTAELSGGRMLRFIPQYIAHRVSETVNKIFPEDTAPFVKALIIGDRRDFYSDVTLKANFTRAGLSHVVAISGMHITFLAGLLQMFIGKRRKGAIVSIAVVWIFALAVGASPSAVRAAFMQTMVLFAPVVYRENDPITALSAALSLILLSNPMAAMSVSLQLSFASVAGIILFAPSINDAMVSIIPEKFRFKPLCGIITAVSVTASVMVFSMPLTAVHFGYLPIVSALSNILVLFAVSWCFAGSIAACLLSLIPFAGELAAWLVSWVVRYIYAMASLTADIPFAVLYTQTKFSILWMVLLYGAFLIFALTKLPGWVKFLAPTLIAAASFALVLSLTENEYENGGTISVLDVGQGQCVAVMAENATAVIDCGSVSGADAGAKASEYLRSCGRDRINVFALTHLHSDHANGAVTLMELMPVDTLILPENAREEPDTAEKILDAAERHGTEVYFVSGDSSADCGDIHMRMFSSENGDENERSMIFRVSIGDFDALITGDCGAEEEELYARTHDVSKTELLVVGHHGAKTSSSDELLRKLDGRYAVISTGYNFYGHPHSETLERLEAYGYNTYRTDADGTVEIRIE